ncbi:MAG: beta-ketoacyl-[acyl-carrier-protein] synthase family protein, partial [Planctomycetes bacterium]|nr:beta-ketoacyl-[acyl-carrier-protein] synthase family protein [Planctomycetota bacterium]
MRRRLVITGIGIVSPLGLSAEDHFNALVSGTCAIAPISLFEAGDFPAGFAAEVKGFRANKFVKNRKSIKIMARDIRLAVAAAALAAKDAGISDGTGDPELFGVSIGAGLIPTELDELAAAVSVSLDGQGHFDLAKYGREGLANLFPLWLLKYLPNMLNSHISIENDAQGPNNCITSGNASGLLAIGEAARVIERGQADIMLAGGAESKIHPLSLVRLHMQGKLSTAGDLAEKGPQPFCKNRSGLVVGEAGAIVVIEEAGHAAARGARIYAEVTGFGSSCGGHLANDLDAGALAATYAMQAALGDARLNAADVDAVFADASGLPEDAAEATAIAGVLGKGKAVTTTRAAAG